MLDQHRADLGHNTAQVSRYILELLSLRPCPKSTRFEIQTDHDALKWISSLADACGRLARWRLPLYKFECYVVHFAGINQKASRALSWV